MKTTMIHGIDVIMIYLWEEPDAEQIANGAAGAKFEFRPFVTVIFFLFFFLFPFSQPAAHQPQTANSHTSRLHSFPTLPCCSSNRRLPSPLRQRHPPPACVPFRPPSAVAMGVEHYTRVRKLGKGSFGESVDERAHEASGGRAVTAAVAIDSRGW